MSMFGSFRNEVRLAEAYMRTLGSRRAVAHICTRRGAKKEGDNRKLCLFQHLVPSCPGQRGRKCAGLPTLIPHPSSAPDHPKSIRFSYPGLPKVWEKTTMSFYMKMPAGSQTMPRNLKYEHFEAWGPPASLKGPGTDLFWTLWSIQSLSFFPSSTVQALSCLASEIWCNLEN